MFSKFIDKTKIFVIAVKETLTHHEQPLYVTVLFMFFTAGLTYWIAPKINDNFEKERRRSELVITQVRALNDETTDTLENLTALMQSPQYTGQIDLDAKRQVAAQLTNLQWKAIELRTLPASPELYETLKAYQSTVTDLSQSVANFETVDDVPSLEVVVVNFAQETAQLNRAMYLSATK